MSNLSDLLPAGAGAKSATFTASGTLATGTTVILQSDGTVKAVAEISGGLQTPATFVSNSINNLDVTYDATSGKVVAAYRDGGNNNYGTAVVGTISGTTITWGTPVVFEAANSFNIAIAAGNSQVVIGYADNGNNNYPTIVSGTISGTSITFGTPTVPSSEGQPVQPDMMYINPYPDNPTYAHRFVFAYSKAGYNDRGIIQLIEVSSSNVVSSAGESEINGTAQAGHLALATSGGTYGGSYYNMLCMWRTYSGSSPMYYVRFSYTAGSPGSLSFGTAATSGINDTQYISLAYDTSESKYLVAYRSNSDNDLEVAVGTETSTSTMSFGTPADISGLTVSNVHVAYDATASATTLVFRDTSSSEADIPQVCRVTVSGTTPTIGTRTSVTSGSALFPRVTYAADATASFLVYVESAIGKGVLFTSDSTNSADFVGITDEAIANTATGSVVVEGGVITNSTLLPYYFSFGTATVFDTANYTDYLSAVYDSSAQKVVYFYPDANNSAYGTAIVGTVSGSSISFGTPVVFEAANSQWIVATYDSASNKVVVAYSDAGNSDYGTAIVGTVSGTSISFGTPVVFETSRANYITATFDSSNNRVVIAYQDNLNSNYGTVVVGTVSGTSISFGTPLVFNSGTTYYPALTFDSNANKVVLAYRDGNNSNAGTALVGTVSGTSISFGSAAVFQSSSSNYMTAAFDSNSNKVFITYWRTGSSDGVVGTVSGTSISFGTPVSFTANQTSLASSTFDSNLNQIMIVYKDQGNSNYGTIVNGTISGTTVTFGDNTVFAAVNAANAPTIVFDSTANKTVIGYVDTSATGSGTSIVSDFTRDLVTNSTYYVQDDGSLSTTSSSVTAGKALSSTTLLLKG